MDYLDPKNLKKKGDKFRYSDEMNNILALSPYELDDNIGPAEKFDRLVRFTTKMSELNIQNPYTLPEMLYALKRFSELHTRFNVVLAQCGTSA